MRRSLRVTVLCFLALLLITSLASAQTCQGRINNLVNVGICGSTLQGIVVQRAAGIAPWNRPYVGDGYGDCYGYCRQVWNAVLWDGSSHPENFYPNAYNKHQWIDGFVGGLPVATYVDPNWGPISELGGVGGLLPGDLVGTTQGHRWGMDVHYGLAAGNGMDWDCHGGYGAEYRAFYSGFQYYYRPIHAALAYTPPPPPPHVWSAFARNSNNGGYWTCKQDGSIYSFNVPFYGGSNGFGHQPIVDLESTSNGGGYWQIASDGGVFCYGNAPFHGSLGGITLNAPVVDMSPATDDSGYWMVGADGGIFAFNCAYKGSMGGQWLAAPMVGISSTSTNQGYWLVGADGGIFAFGDAPFKGSMGGQQLNAPIVAIARTPSNQGYWLAAADGGVFAFGDAPFEGSLGALHLNAPICKIVATSTGQGYWLFATDGGVFAFGDAPFRGSPVDLP